MRDEALCNTTKRRRNHFFTSFFFTKLLGGDGGRGDYSYKEVERWGGKVPGKDIFKLDKIIVPCNCSNMHWTCLCVYVQERRIVYYDSMNGSGRHFLNGMMRYIEDEHAAKMGGPLPNKDDWVLEEDSSCPQQRNGCDCGVFTCMAAECLSR